MEPEKPAAQQTTSAPNPQQKRSFWPKIILAIVFISLPFIGFYFGMKYFETQNAGSTLNVTSYEECLQTLDNYMYPAICTAPDGTKWPAPTDSANNSIPPDPLLSDDPQTACAEAEGTWLEDYSECEYVSIDWCDRFGGTFNDCESACRHKPEMEYCSLQCVPVCTL